MVPPVEVLSRLKKRPEKKEKAVGWTAMIKRLVSRKVVIPVRIERYFFRRKKRRTRVSGKSLRAPERPQNNPARNCLFFRWKKKAISRKERTKKLTWPRISVNFEGKIWKRNAKKISRKILERRAEEKNAREEREMNTIDKAVKIICDGIKPVREKGIKKIKEEGG